MKVAALLPITMMVLYFVVGKAFVVAKIALIFAGILALKELTGGSSNVSANHRNDKTKNNFNWNRGAMNDKLAYSAYG